MAIQLTQLEEHNTRLARESSASLAAVQAQLTAVTLQLQDAQALAQALAESQEKLRKAQSSLAAAEGRVQTLTLQVTNLEEQVRKGQYDLETTKAKLDSIDQQLRDVPLPLPLLYFCNNLRRYTRIPVQRRKPLHALSRLSLLPTSCLSLSSAMLFSRQTRAADNSRRNSAPASTGCRLQRQELQPRRSEWRR